MRRLKWGLILPAALLTLLAIHPQARAQELPDWVDRLKISGLAFGDYYWLGSHHDEDLEGRNGFWFRRIYLTFDFGLSEEIDFRLRFEAASPGDFESSSTISPFVKDAWVRWRGDLHSAIIGLSSTPTWDVPEGIWGYRNVEKTPLDLQKMGGSRDLGVALKGQFDEGGKVRYHAMIGNGSGTKGETNAGKKGMLALSAHPGEGFLFQVYGDFESRPGETDRTTIQGFAAWEGDDGRVGVQYAHQEREVEDGDDIDLDIFSIFGVARLSDRVSFLARYDRMFDPNPDAGTISYIPMDPTAKSNLLLAGFDFEVVDRFHLIPNIEVVFYDGVGGAEAPSTDVIPRVTFSTTF